MHFICPVTKLAGNSLLQMLHSEEAVAEGSLASSILSQAAPQHLHTCPGQHTDCYTLHLNDPWGCLSYGCTAFTSQSSISPGLHGKKDRHGGVQLRRSCYSLFCLGKCDFIKWTLLHMITATGNSVRFSTCEASRCWQGNTEGCTRLKPDLEVWKMFFWVPHIFSPLCLTDPELLSAWGEKKSVGIFFSGLISLYGILPLIQLFHRRYS